MWKNFTLFFIQKKFFYCLPKKSFLLLTQKKFFCSLPKKRFFWYLQKKRFFWTFNKKRFFLTQKSFLAVYRKKSFLAVCCFYYPYESLPLLEFTLGRSLCGWTYSRACSVIKRSTFFTSIFSDPVCEVRGHKQRIINKQQYYKGRSCLHTQICMYNYQLDVHVWVHFTARCNAK